MKLYRRKHVCLYLFIYHIERNDKKTNYGGVISPSNTPALGKNSSLFCWLVGW